MVTFPIISDPHKAAFMDWKTTPWILPSNLAICIKANKYFTPVGLKGGRLKLLFFTFYLKFFQWMLGHWWHKFDASTLRIRTCIRRRQIKK
nr:isoleucine--trna ligase, cytoplasmic [Quercus suber]